MPVILVQAEAPLSSKCDFWPAGKALTLPSHP